ncbi:MAG: hypothetical protein IJ100_03965 [Lachnospiraceae bacterium]|nr:hypothetical protein [Lachnospiraceae bacterium]
MNTAFRVIDRHRSQNRWGIRLGCADNSAEQRALRLTYALNEVWDRITRLGSGIRYEGDEAKLPVVTDSGQLGSDFIDWICPTCRELMGMLYVPEDHVQAELCYCPDCGERIDWVTIRAQHKSGGRPDTVNADDVLSIVEEVCKRDDEVWAGMGDDLHDTMSKLAREAISASKGKEPVFKSYQAFRHESHDDGNGKFVSNLRREWCCPVCGRNVGSHQITKGGCRRRPCRFCSACGQKLEWANIELGDGFDVEGLRS